MHRYLVFVLLLFGTAWAADAPKHQAITANCEAFYPVTAVANALGGTAIVSFQLAQNGMAHDIAVETSSGNGDLDKAAAACVASSRYQLEGKPDEKRWQDKVWLYGFKPHQCSGKRPAGVTARGITRLTFVISDDGHVQDARVAQSSGNEALDEAAIACSERWRYKPAIEQGKPVAAPWSSRVVWGDTPPERLSDDKACWRALWPEPDALHDIAGPSVLAFTLTGAGMIDLHVTKSSGRDDLDRAAMTCLSRRNYGEWATESAGQSYGDAVTVDWQKPLPTP